MPPAQQPRSRNTASISRGCRAGAHQQQLDDGDCFTVLEYSEGKILLDSNVRLSYNVFCASYFVVECPEVPAHLGAAAARVQAHRVQGVFSSQFDNKNVTCLTLDLISVSGHHRRQGIFV
jgi:hypothetical protein